jgi:porin
MGAGMDTAKTDSADYPRLGERRECTAEEVLQEPMAGNEGFVSDKSEHPRMTEGWLRRLTKGHRTILHSLFGLLFLAAVSTALAGNSGVNAVTALDNEKARAAAIQEGSLDSRFRSLDMTSYIRFKESLKEKIGFEYSLYYTVMSHFGTRGQPNVNGQLHTINAWTPFRGKPNAGTAVFYYMNISQFTKTSAAQLSDDLGLTSGINDSSVNVDMFRFVGWYQPIADEKVELYLGQFLLRDLYDRGEYAHDDTRFFLSEILSGSPSSTLPGPGLGAAATFNLGDNWSIGGGFSDANAQARDLWNFSTFSKGDYAYMGYLNYRPEIHRLGKGSYKFSIYSVDSTATLPYSWGASLILEQQIGERYAAFFKYNRAERRQGTTRQSMAAALIRKGIHTWEDDLLGVGVGWGDPTDPSRRDEFVVEAFWRMQITPSVQLTPDIQLWLRPSKGSPTDPQAVFSLRGTADF